MQGRPCDTYVVRPKTLVDWDFWRVSLAGGSSPVGSLVLFRCVGTAPCRAPWVSSRRETSALSTARVRRGAAAQGSHTRVWHAACVVYMTHAACVWCVWHIWHMWGRGVCCVRGICVLYVIVECGMWLEYGAYSICMVLVVCLVCVACVQCGIVVCLVFVVCVVCNVE